jgi:hypothetical protein
MRRFLFQRIGVKYHYLIGLRLDEVELAVLDVDCYANRINGLR